MDQQYTTKSHAEASEKRIARLVLQLGGRWERDVFVVVGDFVDGYLCAHDGEDVPIELRCKFWANNSL